VNFQVTDAVEDGLFAERVLNAIKEKADVNDYVKTVLQEIIEYIEKIEQGENNINSLGSNPVESLVQYRKALDIISKLRMNEVNEKQMKHILKEVKKEVNNALTKENIDRSSLPQTYKYFKEAKLLAINEITKESMRRQDTLPWQAPMRF
jgi:hypothetical protein